MPEDARRICCCANYTRAPKPKSPFFVRSCKEFLLDSHRWPVFGANLLQVGVDLWHVPMRSTGSGTSHLIALREDSEAQQAISSEDQPDLQLPPHQGLPRGVSAGGATVVGCQAQAVGCWGWGVWHQLGVKGCTVWVWVQWPAMGVGCFAWWMVHFQRLCSQILSVEE